MKKYDQYNLYHASPIVAAINKLKTKKATEMKKLNKKAKAITAKYGPDILALEQLRKDEIKIHFSHEAYTPLDPVNDRRIMEINDIVDNILQNY